MWKSVQSVYYTMASSYYQATDDLGSVLLSQKDQMEEDDETSFLDDTTAFLKACQTNDIETVTQILERNASLINEDFYSIKSPEKVVSPLYIAAEVGSLAVVRKLLDEGAEVNLLEKSALSIAIENKHDDVAKAILNHGRTKIPPDALNEALCIAVEKGCNVDLVQTFLQCGVDVNSKVEQGLGLTALKIAIGSGNLDIVKAIIEHPKGAIDWSKHKYALYLACQNNHQDTVEYILNNGAVENKDEQVPENINYLNGGDESKHATGATPLIAASYKGHLDVVNLLLKFNPDVHHKCAQGANALFIAAQEGHAKIVEVLLLKYSSGLLVQLEGLPAFANSTRDKDGATPLLIAASRGHYGICEFLVEQGADVNLATNDGKTPLFVAAREGHHSICQLLLDNQADHTKGYNESNQFEKTNSTESSTVITPLAAAMQFRPAGLLAYVIRVVPRVCITAGLRMYNAFGLGVAAESLQDKIGAVTESELTIKVLLNKITETTETTTENSYSRRGVVNYGEIYDSIV